MNGIGAARMRVCRTCPHRRTAYAGVWRWPHCVFEGADLELSDELLSAEGSACPGGRWAGLAPVDVEAERIEREAAALETHRQFVTPWLDAALSRLPDEAGKAGFLVDAVAAGVLRREAAEQRAAREGLPLD